MVRGHTRYHTQKQIAMPAKPDKPYPEFPLFAHQCGQWCKKIRGKLRYFGVWSDPDAAVAKYFKERDEWQAGRTPVRGVGISVADLCNHFLHFKRLQVDVGDVSERTWSEYKTTCERLTRVFGRATPVDALSPANFAELRADIAKTRKAVALSTEVQRCRSVFRYGLDEGHLDRQANMGKNFTKARKVALRRERNARPSKFLTPAEIRAAIGKAHTHLQAMILLAINCGFGQTDLSELTTDSVDLDGGWVDFPRPKTAFRRRCPLWKETVAALRASFANRNKPRACPPDRFFVTLQGHPLVWFKPDRGGRMDSVGNAFRKVLVTLAIKRTGVGFYSLRHTFRTVADETRDTPAIKRIMGHSDEDKDDEMRAQYVEHLSDERLITVSDHVHHWLYAHTGIPS